MNIKNITSVGELKLKIELNSYQLTNYLIIDAILKNENHHYISMFFTVN